MKTLHQCIQLENKQVKHEHCMLCVNNWANNVDFISNRHRIIYARGEKMKDE